MLKTAEFVSLGHPDKTADYISSYILDRMLEQDQNVRYAVEVMIKGNTVVLGGEICGNVQLNDIKGYVIRALCEIGYNAKYHKIWGESALDINQMQVINLIGCQSAEINQGVENGGWGDQGVFAGYACQGEGLLPLELYLAKKLCNVLYAMALNSDNLGIDIKTQVTLNEFKQITTAVVAIPMKNPENLRPLIVEILGQEPQELIVNGTGSYVCHSAVADCGMSGRKLACDFYSLACPNGGGSPWAKDASKADVALNILARRLAVENLADNDEAFVYLSSCIGKGKLPSAVLKTVKDGQVKIEALQGDFRPQSVIARLGLNKPVFTRLCRDGVVNIS